MSPEISSGTIMRIAVEDMPAGVEPQEQIYPDNLTWSGEKPANHLTIAPESQFVAVDEKGKLAGSPSTLFIDLSDYAGKG